MILSTFTDVRKFSFSSSIAILSIRNICRFRLLEPHLVLYFPHENIIDTKTFFGIPVYSLSTTIVSSRLYSEIGNLRRFQSFSNYGPNQLCTIQTLILYHRYISLVSLKLHRLGFPNHEPKPQLYIYKSY